MRPSIFALACLLAAACKPAPQGKPDPSTGTPVTGLVTGVPTGTTTDSTVPVPEFDCATVPDEVVFWQRLENARGYHDVAFTEDGWLIGAGDLDQNVVKSDGTGQFEMFLENSGMVQGMEWLPDGRLAIATEWPGSITAVDPATGARELLIPGVSPYGLIMGPDGKLWSADNQSVRRHDLTTGGSEIVVPSVGGGSTYYGGGGGARVINFDPDNTKLYIGTFAGNGAVYVVDLDASYDPILDTLRVFATGVGDGSYHDGLGVDVCGNLYVPDYGTSALYRISPLGDVTTMFDVQLQLYGHGLEWGNGVGIWREESIYMPLPYGGHRVLEVDVGVPKHFEGNVINRL